MKIKKSSQRLRRGRTRPEIMSPIRDWASLEACKNYADAVYFGLSDLTMRANADVFNLSNLGAFVKKCHNYGIKPYLTVNSVIYNKDIKIAERIIKKAKQVGVDAIIIWDPAAIEIARKYKMKFFISTQANVSNWQSALFYKKLGAARVVLAREMTLKQITELKKKVGALEIETFVHGAMCWSISGRCLLSAAIYGKSANCGSCGQPCRKEWTLEDDEGNKISNQGKYYMSAKDLCMIECIPELIKAGIDSFKIEGRRRDPRYVETVSRCYREAVDAYFNGTYTKAKARVWKKELESVYNRGFETGFYFGDPGPEGISYDKSDNAAAVKKTRIGKVIKYLPKIKVALVKLTEKELSLGEEIYIEGKTTYSKQIIASMQIEGKDIKQAKKGKEVGIKISEKARVGDNVFVLK
ncbi:MAG: U32 family peptidase [Patescibacteria group bacterium]|jgi:putative protease